MSESYRVNISQERAVAIVKQLDNIDSKKSLRLIAYLSRCIKEARHKRVCSLYKPSASLSEEEIINGEFVQLLADMKFLASIYEPKTSMVLRAARERLIVLSNRVWRVEALCRALRKRLDKCESELIEEPKHEAVQW